MAGDTAQNADEEKPLDPAAERVRRKLMRFMIVNLGILFAAVMAVVLALVYQSVSPGDEEPASGPSSQVSAPVPSGEAASGEIPLPAGARVLSHSVSADRLSLHLQLADGGEAIHLYDLQEARLLGRFRLVRQAP